MSTDYAHFGPDEVFLQLAPLSFDASTFEIWGALLNGACLVSVPKDIALSPHRFADLLRAEELTQRTHQLNTTGRSYTHDELHQAISAGSPRVLVADLHDRFGDHGSIGLCVIDQAPSLWTLSLLLVSCRVEGRGIGGVLLARLMQLARDQAVGLRAAYDIVGVGRWGTTIGKRLARLGVVATDGTRAGWWRAVVRFVVANAAWSLAWFAPKSWSPASGWAC